MNSEINKKTPAFIYAKEFRLSKVLGNLQAYKAATGDSEQTEQRASREHYDTNQISNKRKLGKRKNKQNKRRDGGPHYPVPTVNLEDLDEPLPLPECLRKGGADESGSSSQEDDSESSGSETTDFLGVARRQSPSEDDTCSRLDAQCSTSRGRPNKFIHYERSPNESKRDNNDRTVQPLTTYSCTRCNRRGHLTEHCTIPQTKTKNNNQVNVKNTTRRSADVQDLILQCRDLKRSNDASCSHCGNKSNLAFCFECQLILCDGRGHLIEHLLNFPNHTKLFSYKLQRLIKCSNSTCNVVDTDELLVCPQCLSKIFDKQYSLINATWSNRGLKAITNALCCDEHFHWHRMNCYNSSAESLFSRENLQTLQQQGNGLLSEFFF